jgi:hypothetical protein
VQADGGDLRHSCPEARGAHPGGAGELGAGAHRLLSWGARASAEGRRKDYRGAG